MHTKFFAIAAVIAIPVCWWYYGITSETESLQEEVTSQRVALTHQQQKINMLLKHVDEQSRKPSSMPTYSWAERTALDALRIRLEEQEEELRNKIGELRGAVEKMVS
eukprot:Sspe_Gene.27829::Locus_12231_Transcript_3_3_Confidence_0.750_Length_379::g.27829::m.27829